MFVDNRGAKIIRYIECIESQGTIPKTLLFEQSMQVFKECYANTPKEMIKGTDHTLKITVSKRLKNYLENTFKEDENALNRYISMRTRIYIDTLLDEGDLPLGEIGGLELREPADPQESKQINEQIEYSKTFSFVNQESVRWVPKCK